MCFWWYLVFRKRDCTTQLSIWPFVKSPIQKTIYIVMVAWTAISLRYKAKEWPMSRNGINSHFVNTWKKANLRHKQERGTEINSTHWRLNKTNSHKPWRAERLDERKLGSVRESYRKRHRKIRCGMMPNDAVIHRKTAEFEEKKW